MKKDFLNKWLIASLLTIFGIYSLGDEPTGSGGQPSHGKNRIETQLKIDVEKQTKEVHVIRANNDPFVYTRVYVLKNADPYEILPYVRESVKNALRSSGSSTQVEAIKYNDGTGMLIVSAEDYRFEKDPSRALTIDELVENLDQPKITSCSGAINKLYFPLYWKASDLKNVLMNVGAEIEGSRESSYGNTHVVEDDELNALMLYSSSVNIKRMENVLKNYDTPAAEVRINYTVFEVDMEADTKLGADFQAWKNGDGSRIFSVGHRTHQGWGTTWASGIAPHTHNNNVNYLGLSPKWNTRYLDFLTSNGAAKIMTNGSMTVRTKRIGHIESITELQHFEDDDALKADRMGNDYLLVSDKSFFENKPNDFLSLGNIEGYFLETYDENGFPIGIVDADGITDLGSSINPPSLVNHVTLRINKVENKGVNRYNLSILNPTPADVSFFRFNDRQKLGRELKVSRVKIYKNNGFSLSEIALNDELDFEILRDKIRQTNSSSYGFLMYMMPSVFKDVSVIDILMNNSSLVGYKDDGSPRIAKGNQIMTSIQVKNEGGLFMIGGLEKTTVEHTVTKVPWLGDIPFLGWIFSTEGNVSRKYQIITLLEVIPVEKVAPILKDEKKIIEDIQDSVESVKKAKPGDYIGKEFGYDQWILDDQKKFDSLP